MALGCRLLAFGLRLWAFGGFVILGPRAQSPQPKARVKIRGMRLTAVRLLVAMTAVASVPSAAAAATCDSLTSLSVKNGTVTLAQTVAPGAFTPPSGRAGGPGANAFATLGQFCRVAVTLKPAPRSDIKAEVWLPSSGWNGKLQVVGNGGFAGTISYPAMATALRAGYAAASTDTGHTGPSSNTFANERRPRGLRSSRHSRDRGCCEDNGQRFLWQRAEVFLFHRMLDRRTSGTDRGAALPRGFQRHRRRRAGQPHVDAGLRSDLVFAGTLGSGWCVAA